MFAMTPEELLSKCIDTANKYSMGSVSDSEMENALKTKVTCLSCHKESEFVDFLQSLPSTGIMTCPSCGWKAAGY